MSKHTQGPWNCLEKQKHQQFIEVTHDDLHTPGASSGVIARVTCRVSWQEEQEANARLIAAAPDLLEALLDARYKLYGNAPGCPKIEAAITKATGA